jgi:hypothetical protein
MGALHGIIRTVSSRRGTEEKTPKGPVTKGVTRISENDGAGFIQKETVCLYGFMQTV